MDPASGTADLEEGAEQAAQDVDRAAEGEEREASPTGPAAAFFDLDKTLIPGSSLFLLGRAMYDRDLFRVRDIVKFGWEHVRYRWLGERPEGISLSRQATLRLVRGRSREELMDWGRELAEERILPRVYRDVVSLIDSHRRHGHRTYLVTAAPAELAGIVAEALDMTGAVATVAEVDDRGVYTGELVGPVVHGEDKAKAVADVASREGIDLDISAAYSDSVNDLPLLEMVGFPHAVNPEHRLRREARARAWPVHWARPRRHSLLIGIPAGLGGAALLGGGVAIGVALERRAARNRGRSLGPVKVSGSG
jgi:HAD superfamily hydrolase (TIGR01490 family)